MGLEKSNFRGNVTNVEFLENKLLIHYHLRKNWNVSDLIGVYSLYYTKIDELDVYQNRDGEGTKKQIEEKI